VAMGKKARAEAGSFFKPTHYLLALSIPNLSDFSLLILRVVPFNARSV
jgi:hypothetical protein